MPQVKQVYSLTWTARTGVAVDSMVVSTGFLSQSTTFFKITILVFYTLYFSFVLNSLPGRWGMLRRRTRRRWPLPRWACPAEIRRPPGSGSRARWSRGSSCRHPHHPIFYLKIMEKSVGIWEKTNSLHGGVSWASRPKAKRLRRVERWHPFSVWRATSSFWQWWCRIELPALTNSIISEHCHHCTIFLCSSSLSNYRQVLMSTKSGIRPLWLYWLRRQARCGICLLRE